MRLSVVIVTCNRRAALAATLDRLAENASLPHGSMEVLIVDNGSSDGTREVAAREDLDIRLIARPRNEGVSARNHAFAVARGEYLLLIDDDSYPLGDAVIRSMRRLEEEAKCAAVVGRIELPDGALEASALPSIIANGAVVLRKSVIDQIGGFPREFFRQAEEYDLSFRIWNAGYTVERFEDLHYRHEKVGGHRAASVIHRMDMRNNLILVDRYLPAPWRGRYRADWAMRYLALGRHAGATAAVWRGRFGSWPWRLRDRLAPRPLLGEGALESIFGFELQAARIAQWKGEHAIRRVVIADLGKNIRATLEGCRAAGLEILAVADNHPALIGLTWEGLPVLTDSAARMTRPDGVILSNVNPARVAARLAELQREWSIPTLGLWEPRLLGGARDGGDGTYRDAA